MDTDAIYKYYTKVIKTKSPMVINSLITFCKEGENDLIPNKLFKQIKKLKLSTSSQLLLYDLEDLMEDDAAVKNR